MRFYLLLFISFFSSIISYAQLNGVYTIGGATPDYATITSAVNDLVLVGVNGPVTFNIRSGTYSEHVIIPEIVGASAVNRVTFQSEALDSTAVRWEFNNAVLADNYVCKLNGADFISLRYLTLARDASTSSGSHVVVLENGAHNARLEHCRILGKSNIQFSDHEVVYSPTTIDTATYIGYCNIQKGYKSVYLTGTSGTTLEGGIVIERNIISSTTSALNCIYVNRARITNNQIDGYVTLNNFNGKTLFGYNKVTAGWLDIQYHLTTVSDSLIVVGNMVKGTTNYAVYLRNCPLAIVFHNTLVSSFNSSTSAGVLYTNNSYVRSANNILHNLSSGYAAYFTNSTVVSDYNIFYSTFKPIYRTTAYATLAAWQTASLNDMNSFFSSTSFIGVNDLHIFADIEANSNGFGLGVAYDLDGDPRSSTPDIGADEFDHPDHDAGVIALTGIPFQVCSGNLPINVQLRNLGEADLTSATINWTVNGITQTPFSWTGTIPSADTALVTLGTYTFAPGSTYNIVVWSSVPNGQTDAIPANDSYTHVTVYTMLQGSYTIGGTAPNFTTFNAAVNALVQRGICGPVVFNVRSGIYNEYLNFDGNTINGCSLTNTVTFQSEVLDSSMVQLSLPSSSFPNWLVTVPNMKHFIFRQISFKRTAPYGSNYELFVLNNADNVKFENCVFEGANRYYGMAVRFNTSKSAAFTNCEFRTIRDGIAFSGSGSPTKFKSNNNIFNNLSGSAITAGTVTDSLEILGNHFFNDTITMPDGTTSSVRGIGISYSSNYINISRNRMEGRFSGGIELTCLYATAATKVKVHNNFLAIGPGFMGGASQGSVGISLYSCNYIEMLHNSIYMYNTPWASSNTTGYLAIALNPAETYQNLIFKNNLIVADSIDAIFGFPASWNTSFLEFDHNNIYRYDPQTVYTVAAGWPGSWNANTTAIRPIFYSRYDLHVLNPQLAMGTAVWTSITEDIDGDTRIHPTVGADEGNFVPINIGGIMAKVERDCDSATVSVKVFNYCLDTITKFDVASTANGVGLPNYVWNGTLYPGDTTDWIMVGKFAQTHGQNYSVVASTQLPNDETDLNQFNDTVYINYQGQNPVLELGMAAVGCLPDSLLLTHDQNAVFTNFLWNTGLANDTLYVNSSGTYTLSAVNQYGCATIDSVAVVWGGGQVPVLSQLEDTLYTSVTTGSNVWYMNETIMNGETNTTLTLATYGDYYVLNTDAVGCTVSSDTLHILNYRDVGTIEIYPVHACSTTALSADVKNYSTQTMSSFKIDVLLDGSLQNTITWNGSVAPGDTVFAIDLGSVPHLFGNTYQVEVYTYLPNAASDLDPLNDSEMITYTLLQDPFDLGADIEMCPGDIALLELADSSLFANFSWANGGSFASQSTDIEDEYFLEGTDSFGCVRLDSVSVFVGGDLNPTITLSGGVLSSSLNDGNQWYLDGVLIPGADGDTYQVAQDGDYSLIYTDSLGCTNTSNSLYVQISGLSEQEMGLLVYPNPGNSVINVLVKGSEELTYELIDLAGKVVLHGTLQEGNNALNVEQLAAGSYSLRCGQSFTVIRIMR